jgi:methylated-DNA-[protein]-cysteine S-methyltransferase
MIDLVLGQEVNRRHENAPTHTVMASPVGELTLVRQAEDLVGLYYPHHRPAPSPARLGVRGTQGFEEFETQLSEYLAGARRHFDVPFRAIGHNHDQKVWSLVARVPYGETVTYGEVAREFDDGTTPQEIGAALARNPLCIVIPCHRVVGADGRLTGYAGGLWRKRLLLDLEQGVVGNVGRLF